MLHVIVPLPARNGGQEIVLKSVGGEGCSRFVFKQYTRDNANLSYNECIVYTQEHTFDNIIRSS